jgi:activator of 2-hydroxyglutaryl-CoA dehydratase/predicted nucleotide-binding protein (sugar kinase/HSP70/actin superfamily)
MADRFIGIDVGAETIKVAEVRRENGAIRWTDRRILEHHKEPASRLLEILGTLDWYTVRAATVSGRLSRQVNLPRIPLKQAQAAGFRHLGDDGPATVVSIGSHGFSVLELRERGPETFRENSRCSQGTGNFLRQLVERFELTVEDASRLCEEVENPAPLSGRCPVILKTDMTHLANKGESRARILAGLYDAVCENVLTLVKPRVSPEQVTLIGGVGRSRRIRQTIARLLRRHGMTLTETNGDDSLFYEAVGCALQAAREGNGPPPELDRLFGVPTEHHLETLPALAAHLGRVRRMPPEPRLDASDRPHALVLGFDIGSTGSKTVALDPVSQRAVQEEYVSTNGNPVGAAQTLMARLRDGIAGDVPVVAVGATGSGREIVGSLMNTCYGCDAVFVMNEIAAHAEGALHYDPKVDTIFEIGGQDAKYIRLSAGRVVDAAMNEACSAGTGSFIEEQGRKFANVEGVVQLGEEALRAPSGISLGQHCSVFMAEVIDESVAGGVEQGAIIAGLYDSVIQNYLNRVKGNRDVGDVIFCQGMPFASDALASAVARQTGSTIVVPPNPGTVGALGIALLTLKERAIEELPPLDLQRFLDAEVVKRDTFVCGSTQGCGGTGNHCRIDRISTVVDGERRRFSWGGGCSLHDSGTGKIKLPDLAPDPFREREELAAEIAARVSEVRGGKCIALTDEFMLKGLFPFFATYLHRLGLDVVVHSGADQSVLKRGIEAANVPFCAPMQLFHGIAGVMAEDDPDYLFLPMLRGLPRVKDEKHSVVCPIGQASGDILRWDLGDDLPSTVLSPVIDFGPEGLASEEFAESCRKIAAMIGVNGSRWRQAFDAGVVAQTEFDGRCLEMGRRAMEFCASEGIVPVVVLGRSYTIYNDVLNSNVPKILREQGTVAIPVDCYPVEDDVPVFEHIYWGQAQRNLRAAHQIRRTTGVYSLFCSNYACGPDSFGIHFYGYVMQGKPFAVIETDGHSGDAGTKTRVEAFLYCVQEDLRRGTAPGPGHRLDRLEKERSSMEEIRRDRTTLLVPYFARESGALAAALRGVGIPAEALPVTDQEVLRIGRRYTSGKECVPMCLTLGSFLKRIQDDPDPDRRFALLMPTTRGPCRFGVYNLLEKIILERVDLRDRIGVWSPPNTGYFSEFRDRFPAFSALAVSGMVAADTLSSALYDVRPVETEPGAADEIHDRYFEELLALLERKGQGDMSRSRGIREVVSGRMFGCGDLLRRAADEFRAINGNREIPTVLVVGEIYMRSDPFSNDFIVDQLERRGIRGRLVTGEEWYEYTAMLNREDGRNPGLSGEIGYRLQMRVHKKCHAIMGGRLGWPARTGVHDTLEAARPYIRTDLRGEAALTLGGPVHEWRRGEIHGAVSVGPLECMPSKIAETQFFHVAEREGLPSLTLGLNGEPIDPEVLDNFAFEVHERNGRRSRSGRFRDSRTTEQRHVRCEAD